MNYKRERREFRVIHLTVVRYLFNGLRKQLEDEDKASLALSTLKWQTIAYHDLEPRNTFEKQIPKIFRLILLRQIYSWFIVVRLSRRCDVLMVRYIPFDLVSIFVAPFIRNLVSVHHSKETVELRLVRSDWRGRAAAWLEAAVAPISSRFKAGIVAVTPEILAYQRERYPKKNVWSGLYSNGIDMGRYVALPDRRNPNVINAAFVCSQFSSWHGLDRLLESLDKTCEHHLAVNLIGIVPEDLVAQIDRNPHLKRIIRVHGPLSYRDYEDTLAGCDVGIGSLAMDRGGLREGSTLKVREYLALGLPVYATHSDPSFPATFPYLLQDDEIDIARLVGFAWNNKKSTRADVRAAARTHIEKGLCLERLAVDLVEGFGHQQKN